MPTVNEDLYDRMIRHQVYLQGLATGTTNRVVAVLNRSEPRIVAEIQKRADAIEAGNVTAQRFVDLLAAIQRINRDAHIQAGKVLRAELEDLAVYEYEFTRRMVEDTVPIRLDIATPSRADLRAVVHSRPFQGRFLREWIKGLEDARAARLRDSIRLGVVEGRTVDQMIRAIRGTKAQQYRDGILEISRRGAEMVVRTAVNHTANAAKQVFYEENADLIKGVRWTSTLDTRTSPVCRARDGQVFPVDSGPRPPAHPNCRSVVVPVVKSFRELGIDMDEAPAGTRASMDGQVPADTTYAQWLAKQSAEVQDDILGKTRGELFRKGGLEIDRFVARNGHVFTLDQLRRREADAFRRAGL